MKIISIFSSFILILCCASCVKYSDDLLESSKTQISHEFYTGITYPSDFVVMLSPADTTYIRNGVKQPITLHTLIEKRLHDLHFIRPGHSADVKYALTVKKQMLAGNSDAFSAGYTDALENMGISEATYIIEIFLDEVAVNPAGEEVFGKRLAMFTTPLTRSEADIANDIVNIIMDEIR